MVYPNRKYRGRHVAAWWCVGVGSTRLKEWAVSVARYNHAGRRPKVYGRVRFSA